MCLKKKYPTRVRTTILKCVPRSACAFVLTSFSFAVSVRRKYIGAILSSLLAQQHSSVTLPSHQQKPSKPILLQARTQSDQREHMKYCSLFAIFMSLLSKQSIYSLKVGRPRSLLSRLAVPIGLVVLNTFMMSTSTEGRY